MHYCSAINLPQIQPQPFISPGKTHLEYILDLVTDSTTPFANPQKKLIFGKLFFSVSYPEPQSVLEPETIADLHPDTEDLIQAEQAFTAEANPDPLGPADLSPWPSSTETSPEQVRS